MKVLYLAPDVVPAPKGASVRIRRTVETLLELGHDVELFTAESSGGERLSGVAHETFALPGENFLERMVAFRVASGSWLADRSADLIQFRSIWEGLPALARGRGLGVPTIYEAHGFPSIELPYHFPELRHAGSLQEKLIREEGAALGGATRLITPSLTGARYLQSRGVAPTRISVVPNCVDAAVFTPATHPPTADSPLRLVYQGTLAPWQGLETLIEALTRFRGAPVELHVVGPAKSTWRRRLRGFARRCRVHHQVHLSPATGQADLAPILRTAQVCVAPLPADGRNAVQGCCPIKLLEYMAAARPILATAISPVEEILEHERTGWLVRPGSPLAIADGIAWMLDHPTQREEMGSRAREDALTRWSPATFRANLAAALKSVEA